MTPDFMPYSGTRHGEGMGVDGPNLKSGPSIDLEFLNNGIGEEVFANATEDLDGKEKGGGGGRLGDAMNMETPMNIGTRSAGGQVMGYHGFHCPPTSPPLRESTLIAPHKQLIGGKVCTTGFGHHTWGICVLCEPRQNGRDELGDIWGLAQVLGRENPPEGQPSPYNPLGSGEYIGHTGVGGVNLPHVCHRMHNMEVFQWSFLRLRMVFLLLLFWYFVVESKLLVSWRILIRLYRYSAGSTCLKCGRCLLRGIEYKLVSDKEFFYIGVANIVQ